MQHNRGTRMISSRNVFLFEVKIRSSVFNLSRNNDMKSSDEEKTMTLFLFKESPLYDCSVFFANNLFQTSNSI